VTVIRLAVFAGIVVIIAVTTSKLAPGLLTGFAVAPESDAVEASPLVEAAVAPLPDLPRQVALDADRSGHFVTAARINGRSIDVLVDTGASFVALNFETARRLGIALSKSDFTAKGGTANGIVKVAPIVLAEIRVGNVTVRNVEAAVFPGGALDINLLGMSFLRRLSGFEIDDGELILTQ
jgi:aspartyl protease family protein